MLNLTLLGLSFTVCVIFRSAMQYWKFGSNGLSLLKQPSQTMLFFGLAAVFALQDVFVQHKPTVFQSSAAIVYYLLGMSFTLWAQFTMGKSWQVGIDKESKPGLITHGIFSMTRNPIYIALINIMIGYLILLPTPMSLIMVLGCIYMIRRQVLKEEKYLESIYGEEYLEYKKRVCRW